MISSLLVRWLRVILRLDRYRVEESMKFGTKILVGIRNKFCLGATWFDDLGGRRVISIFSLSFIGMKTRLMNQSIAFLLLITKSNQNASTAYKLGCVVHLGSLNVFMSSENSILCRCLNDKSPSQNENQSSKCTEKRLQAFQPFVRCHPASKRRPTRTIYARKPAPPTIFLRGWKTSDLLTCVKPASSRPDPSPLYDCKIFDGAAVVHALPSTTVSTFDSHAQKTSLSHSVWIISNQLNE